MDIQVMLEQIKGHVNVVTVCVILFAIGSEVMGSNDKIKASSWYGLFKALYGTLKDQVWPKAVAPQAQIVAPAAPAESFAVQPPVQ